MSRLIVTTSFALLSIDLVTKAINRIHEGKGLYYGVAQQPDGTLIVAARRRMISSGAPIEEERGCLLRFDVNANLKQIIEAPFPLRDLHGILLLEREIWATCSFDNFIAIFDGENWSRWNPLDDDVGAASDIHHYNTIISHADQIGLVAHNHGESEYLFFDRQDLSLRFRDRLGRLAHNLWLENDQWFTCSSNEGAIVGSCGFRKEIGGFIRGYAQLDDGRRIVGINESAERAERDWTRSKLMIFNSDWTKSDEISLGDNGMVLDIIEI
jgi:hypothetical protein